ncbi:PfaD family polyunsaturated fatty acid/polyketide biosynthesis protein [Desulfosarcina sp.]|uniref:PfaD family polyunsaturated fatty acid/polyketide biosynthesis protein n=1 Tax=Desulfosarcina sp. TaxID=2027861 RepID=UPI0029A6AC45|nr:PfaD family polyunsaturated fatty acid/polyketide biosynthesis protein [Desulfosarcina sp.]MDX2455717.1 PfaD family polyunsaturated fatty acid/polyketide biosynthesis protein [Desulfosarcina sp.]MDX2493190.1 PfaD family polyunsaturated fatty acid/polyketide biosynthesis protein [Desulfosarcina sp.]
MTHTEMTLNPHGFWKPGQQLPRTGKKAFSEALRNLWQPFYVVDVNGQTGVAQDGMATLGTNEQPPSNGYPLLGWSPSLDLASIGDPGFKSDHGLTFAYICGAMANGITSTAMVEAAGRAGMIGFFGAGGLPIEQIESAIDALQKNLGSIPYGFNLIHSPNDMALEQKTVDLYLAKEIRLVSASAYLDLTMPLVEYRIHGIHRNNQGKIVCPNRIIAKVSREEVARKFFAPPAEKHLRHLKELGKITDEQAELAHQIPMAQDLTAEADSGGHTDNRPALCLFPTMVVLRDEMARQHDYGIPLRVGLAGGIATPESAAAAFAMGAAYILTGSVNQSCVEADTSLLVKKMLAEARQADVIMAPAADMFELGVKVQVLKRGTMFSMRGSKLYDIYRTYDRFEDVPEDQRKLVEETFLKNTFEAEWETTRAFFSQRDPAQVDRVQKDPKHKMALVFRSYLGKASLWAKSGVPERAIDYQIWCGPAMGAFNEWIKGSFLEPPPNRKTVTVALNLLYGAAVISRLNGLKNQGIDLPVAPGMVSPITDAQISSFSRRDFTGGDGKVF